MRKSKMLKNVISETCGYTVLLLFSNIITSNDWMFFHMQEVCPLFATKIWGYELCILHQLPLLGHSVTCTQKLFGVLHRVRLLLIFRNTIEVKVKVKGDVTTLCLHHTVDGSEIRRSPVEVGS